MFMEVMLLLVVRQVVSEQSVDVFGLVLMSFEVFHLKDINKTDLQARF